MEPFADSISATREFAIKPEPANAIGATKTTSAPHSQLLLLQELLIEATVRNSMLGAAPVLLDGRERRIGIHVASTGTITQFTCGVLDRRIFGFLMWTGLIVSGMAAGAIWLECRELPINHLGVALVTRGTSKVAAVIERFVWQARVAVVSRSPRVRVMAQAAVLCGVEVSGILAGCNSTVMARCARPKHLVVVNDSYGSPHVGTVAILANIGGQRMHRTFASCVRAVVTADAIACYVCVIESRR